MACIYSAFCNEGNVIKPYLVYQKDAVAAVSYTHLLQKLMDYAPAKGAEYATYIFPFIRDAMLRFLSLIHI